MPSNDTENKAGDSDRPTKPVACVILDAQAFIEEYRNNNQQTEAREKKKFFWERVAGVVIAIYTLLTFDLVCIGYKSFEATRESFTAVQRPFITAKELAIGKRIPFMWDFTVIVENSGSTPTTNMEFITISDLSPPADPEDIYVQTPQDVYGQPPRIPQRYTGLLGPKAQMPLVGSFSGLPHNVVAKMAEDRTNWYIRGVIHYRDLFRETSEHITKFCFAAIPYKDGGELRVSYDRCLYWNCADEDCKKDNERYARDLKALNPQLNKSK